jgi:hypothetical protein
MDLEDLRLLVYDNFRRLGRVPSTGELATTLLATEHEVAAGIRELATLRHVALDDDNNIVMAHPFAAINLGFSVMGRSTLWWAGAVGIRSPSPIS